jgi:hypothetical protein
MTTGDMIEDTTGFAGAVGIVEMDTGDILDQPFSESGAFGGATGIGIGTLL